MNKKVMRPLTEAEMQTKNGGGISDTLVNQFASVKTCNARQVNVPKLVIFV